MAKKRFTDIEIWDREWYMELKPVHKCLIKYIFDKCDASGCWKPNWKLASLHIGEDVRLVDLSKLPKDQYEVLENGKIFIPDFVKFQYGKLSKECRPHIPIISLIEKNGLSDRFIDGIEDSGSSVKALRKRLTEQYKKEIIEQDGFQCQYCADMPSIDNLVVDHIVALSKGGDNSDLNLTTSCKRCNYKKHDDDVFEFLEKNNFTPLNNLYKKLYTLSKKIKTLEEKERDKEKEIDMDKEEEKEKEKEGISVKTKDKKTDKLTNFIDFEIKGIGKMNVNFYSECEGWQIKEIKDFLTKSQQSFEAMAMSNPIMNNLENFNIALQEFINLIQSANDYQEAAELRKYFRNWINKKNGTLETFLNSFKNNKSGKKLNSSFL